MAELTKTKVIDIRTGKSEKNVKTLKQQIKELRDQMALLEIGTEEYNRVGKQLADLNQKQIEINEAMKYSNQDIGQTLSNLTTISAGAIGAFNGVSAALQIVGVSGEDAEEAMKTIQLTMAVIQGMSAVDTAIKAIDGLRNAFKGLNAEKGINVGTVVASTGADLGEAKALKQNTDAMSENIEKAKDFDKANKSNTDSTIDSTNAILAQEAARKGDMATMEQYMARLERLKNAEQEAVSTAKNQGYSVALKYYQEEIENTAERINTVNERLQVELSKGLDTTKTKKELSELQKEYVETSKAFNRMIQTGITEQEDLVAAFNGKLRDLNDSVDVSYEDVEENLIEINQLIAGMPIDVAKEKAKELSNEMASIVDNFEVVMANASDDEEYAGYEEQYNDLIELQKLQQETTAQTIAELEANKREQEELTSAINRETNSQRTNTKETRKNTDAKEDNADASKKQAKGTKELTTQEKLSIPIHKRVAEGIKGIGKAISTLIKANPVLFAIMAVIGAIAGAIAIYSKQMKKLNEHTKTMSDLMAQANNQYDEQNVRLQTLLQTARDENEGLEERKKAIEELNKLVPNYNAQLDETSGKYTENTTALNDYLAKLKEKLLLEAYEGKIKEYLQEQLEIQERINEIETNGFNLFGWRINKKKKEIDELDEKIKKMFDEIKNLDLSKALDDNKITNGSTETTIVKTWKEIFKELKDLYLTLWDAIYDEKEFRKVFNGVYNELDIALNTIKRNIKSKDLGGAISDEFKQALENGLSDLSKYDVTIDFIFGEDNIKDLENRLINEQNRLTKMMKSGKKYTDKEIAEETKTVNLLKSELANRKALAESVQKYADLKAKEGDELAKASIAMEQYNKQLEVEKQHRQETRSGNAFADINKEIISSKDLIKQIDDRTKARQNELKELKSKPNQNKQVLDRIKQLNKEEIDDEKAKNETLTKLDEVMYKARLKTLEIYYGEVEKRRDESAVELENDRILKGWGTADYNTSFDLLNSELTAIRKKMAETQDYYRQQVLDGLMSEFDAEKELQGAMTQLEQEESEKRLEIKKAEVDRKIQIQQTYYNVMNTLTGQIQGLLSAEMANYDQNSKEYKNLAIANGTIDVLSGTLSAFMSGIQSGVPAPYNLALAGVMSAIVFATGLAQLRNIQNGNLSDATTSNVNWGTYDTLSYKQNSEILSNIKDSKVYVLESEITNTQKKVSVTESNSTF